MAAVDDQASFVPRPPGGEGDGELSATPAPVIVAGESSTPRAAPAPRFAAPMALLRRFGLLALVIVAGLGLCVLAALNPANPPKVLTGAIAPAPSASAVAASTSASASPSSSSTESPEAAGFDDEDGDANAEPTEPRHVPRHRAAHARSHSHAPDAKPGVATGYEDGKVVRLVLTLIDEKPVEEHTAAAFKRMRAAARRAGVTLRVVSGFRTMERQRELYADYLAGRGHVAALPGHSNHQSGRALDLAVAGANVRAWLEAHAAEFGFHRTVPNEPWHWES